MRILVTGAAGFVARHLAAELLAHGHELHATDIVDPKTMPNFVAADICDPEQVRALVRDVRPDACIHLGGIAFVPDGDRNPGRMLGINVGGTVNLLKACQAEAPKARFLFVSTAQTYGCSPRADAEPVSEESPLCPLSMYTISKAAAEQAVRAWGVAFGLDVAIARPTNHTGPGQTTRFIVPSLVEQAKKIRRGEASAFVAGNLACGRDFADVRDVVAAYRLLAERAGVGGTYNVSTGQHVTIAELLARIQRLAGTDAPIEVDAALVRPTDFSRVLDTSRLRGELGWTPRFTLDDTLRDMLDEEAK